MKIICAIFFFTASFLICNNLSGQTSNHFHLIGKINGIKSGSIELLDHFGNDPTYEIFNKRAKIINGNFEFKGKLSYPMFVYFTYRDKEGKSINTTEFFLDFGKQYFNGTYNSYKNNLQFRMQGYGINYEFDSIYLPRFNQIEKRESELYRDYDLFEKIQNANSVDFIDSIKKRRKKISEMRDSIFFKYILTNKHSYISLWILAMRLELNYTDSDDKAFGILDRRLQTSFLGKTIQAKIINHKKTLVGAFFPKFYVLDTDSSIKKFPFTKFKNNTLIYIDLWFSRCTPCIIQFKKLNEINNLYKNKGFEMIGLSVKEKSLQEWKTFIAKNELPWPQYFDYKEFVIYKLNIQSFPSNFLIDDKGKILARDLEPIQLKEILQKRFSVPTPK